ncbi:hypothetical protein M9Y10_000880 [Tritrichomonas musculus]|uniref:Uncharacterized protein n=1 Tax=Tritrichomonas musculus TaxID=1915356 RepID=A0ABR2L5G1_9EUKA
MHNLKYIYDSFGVPFESTIFSVIHKKSQIQSQLQTKDKSSFNVPTSELFKSYLDNLQKFISTQNSKSIYDPVSRAFVAGGHRYDKIFGIQPMISII